MSLELKGTITAHVAKYRSWSSAQGKVKKKAQVVVYVHLDAQQAKAIGGKLFAEACFADYVGGSGALTATQKKLGGELEIKREHTMRVAGYSFSARPQIQDTTMSDISRSVTVTLVIPVPFSAAKLRHILDDANGDDVDIVFEGVAQGDIEDAAKANGKAKGKHGFAVVDGAGKKPKDKPKDTAADRAERVSDAPETQPSA